MHLHRRRIHTCVSRRETQRIAVSVCMAMSMSVLLVFVACVLDSVHDGLHARVPKAAFFVAYIERIGECTELFSVGQQVSKSISGYDAERTGIVTC